MAIQVLSALRKIYSNATLTMVGPDKDDSLNDCRKLVANLGLQDYVVFTGRLSKKEWVQLAKTHDIFINTTNADNLPVSVIEAMALGMIVISTNVGGMPYLVRDDVNGLLVDVNDIADMANKVIHVCGDTSPAEKLSTNAFTTSKQFDCAVVMQQWCNLLSGL